MILVVEGPDDKIALRGIVDEKTCDVEFLEGKQKVYECLKKVNEQKRDNIVGLVDSDYDKILKDAGSPPPISVRQYLFLTDTHDMNTMVVASRAFFKMLESLFPFLAAKTGKADQIRDHAVMITKQIGLVRCLNADRRHPERFNFRETVQLDYPFIRQYLDIPQKKIKFETLLAILKKDLSPKQRYELCQFIAERYEAQLNARYQKDDLPWQLCQGHDLFAVLYTLIEEEGFRTSNFSSFSVLLFKLFGIEEFKESGKILHQRMKEWETKAMKNGKQFRILKAAQ